MDSLDGRMLDGRELRVQMARCVGSWNQDNIGELRTHTYINARLHRYVRIRIPMLMKSLYL
jgi:hypothetical protein